MLQLKKLPDIPVSTLEEARGSHPHPEEPRFRLVARDEGHFAALSGKNSRRSPLTSRGGALHRKGERNSRVVPPFQESPRCLSPFQRNLFALHYLGFHAEDRIPRRGLTPTTLARGTALWESLVGKPRVEATDPLIQAMGSVTLLLQLWRKAHVHAPIRDEDLIPWGDSRITPRSMSALERNPQVPAPTPHKVLGLGIDGRGIPRDPRGTRMGTGLS